MSSFVWNPLAHRFLPPAMHPCVPPVHPERTCGARGGAAGRPSESRDTPFPPLRPAGPHLLGRLPLPSVCARVSLSLSPEEMRGRAGRRQCGPDCWKRPGRSLRAGSSGLPRPHAGPPAPPNGRSLKLAETRGTLGWGQGFRERLSSRVRGEEACLLRIGPRGRRPQKLLIKCLSP